MTDDLLGKDATEDLVDFARTPPRLLNSAAQGGWQLGVLAAADRVKNVTAERDTLKTKLQEIREVLTADHIAAYDLRDDIQVILGEE